MGAATLDTCAAVDPSCHLPAATTCGVSSLGWVWSEPFVGLSNPRLAMWRGACGSQRTGSLRSRTTALLRGFRSLLARPWSTTPEGTSRHRVGKASGLRRKIDIMASKTRIENAAKPNTRNTNDRRLITLEMALALCPNAALADNLSTTFGLDPVDAA